MIRLTAGILAGLCLVLALGACDPASGPRPETERVGYS